jgi:4-amino-4-deoxy-L-arabinose transferase-like glycosyltransferase
VASLLACLPPLLIDLGRRDSTHTMENVALVVSQETWLRSDRGELPTWYLTTNDHIPRLEKPPLLTWLNFAAWWDLEPGQCEPALLVHRARLVSVALTLVLLGAIFWLGLSLADLRLAVMATLIAGTMMLVQKHGRTASYDIQFVAWMTLAVAAGVWAVNPRGDPATRVRVLAGWAMCGLALLASALTKNPVAVLLAIPPLGLVIGLAAAPTRRRQALLGMTIAAAVATLIVGTWYLFASRLHPLAGETLWDESRKVRRWGFGQWYYYLGLIGLVVPWSVWLVSGLFHPFVTQENRENRMRWVPLAWFVGLVVVFSLSSAKQQRYILPIVPAAALLTAWVWRDHSITAARGTVGRPPGELYWPHWLGLIVCSILLLPFLTVPELLDLGVVGAMPWPAAVAFGGGLLVLSLLGLHLHRQWRPDAAFAVSVLWSLVFFSGLWHVRAAAPTATKIVRDAAETFVVRLGGAPVRSLRMDDADRYGKILNEEFRFYSGRLFPHVTPDDLAAYLADAAPRVYVLTRDDDDCTELMLEAGLRDDGLFRVDRRARFQRLWVRE